MALWQPILPMISIHAHILPSHTHTHLSFTRPPVFRHPSRYDDVANAGNLDDDTPEVEQPEIEDSMLARLPPAHRDAAQRIKDVAKMPSRTKALMQRFGGHPYENYDMIPYQVLGGRLRMRLRDARPLIRAQLVGVIQPPWPSGCSCLILSTSCMLPLCPDPGPPPPSPPSRLLLTFGC